jgi:lipid biosynthesis B12-binding/radical SAM protein
MSRILLAYANLTLEPYPVYPLGMAVVASGLEARGHQVAQFDALAAGDWEPALRDRIRTFAPEFLGISIRNLDTCDSTGESDYPSVTRRLVEVVRSCTRAPIILGGAAFSLLPEQLLDFTGADHGIAGEGEWAMADLVEGLAEGRPMARVVRWTGASAPQAGPRYDPDLVAFYGDRSGLLNLQTKRGCPHRCAYCDYPALEGRAWRPRDPRQVVDDLEEAQARFGSRDFFFTDSVFNDEGGHHMEVVEELLRRGSSVRWSCYMRPQGLVTAHLERMKRAGLQSVELGTDAATDLTLRRLGKGFAFDDVAAAHAALRQCRIPCAHFVMFGGPGETEATLAEGLRNLERLEGAVVFAFSGIRIFPGTPLHALALREGQVGPGDTLLRPAYYFSGLLDRQAMEATLTQAFRRRRGWFFPPERGRERMAALQGLGLRGLLWDTLVRFPKEESPSLASEGSPC